MRTIWFHSAGKLLSACLLALSMITTAQATAFSIDNTDLWLTRNEDGWGMQLIHRADVMFATIYVYDEHSLPIYYTVTLTFSGTAVNGDAVWAGDLYYTRGPWFGLPDFDRNLVTYRKVGQLTFASQGVGSASLSYSVDGLIVDKAIYRYPMRNDDYTGSYIGAYEVTTSRCFDPADNGTAVRLGTLNVLSQSSNSLSLVTNAYDGVTCDYPGDYQQFGQFGQSAGSFSCTNGQSGSYTLQEMNVTRIGIQGRISGSNNLGCTLSGTFSALRQ
jgi:hypothetical protein